MIIAIDGPAAAGKGTLARRLAKHFGFAYLDTGSLYRAVGLSLLRAGIDPSDEKAAAKASAALDMSLLNDPALREETTGGAASQVAAMPQVRSNLLAFQRNFASLPPENRLGAVLDGRDVGTVICPDAPVKFFVTATAEERAKRRTAEMQAAGKAADYEEILKEVKARDDRDMNRSDAPMKPHADALLLDTTNLDIDAVFSRAKDVVKARL